MSGLDPLGRKMVKDLIVELKEEGTTVFFNTHILADVEDICDRVSIIDG
jgi:ABC-2 type transport system ATP-binding protein